MGEFVTVIVEVEVYVSVGVTVIVGVEDRSTNAITVGTKVGVESPSSVVSVAEGDAAMVGVTTEASRLQAVSRQLSRKTNIIFEEVTNRYLMTQLQHKLLRA